ncbi:WXG100 family type VII secretion target [Hamadaea tsunoensis]|uniref:WXG100 family type VII secretion target n=1 Tax=Hamadaea tsunoensis TaxID=53368 RepID=UPI0004254E66|nr:hypothetical protein [Hamadaea tsunoensis]
MTNPLVAQAHSSTTWNTGLGLVEDAAQVANGIHNHSWVDATLGGVGGTLDILGMVIDPIGSLVAWGVSWLMEHLKPLKEALDWLAGNPDKIAAHAQTWKNVSQFTDQAREQFADAVRTQTAQWVGDSGDAYREHAGIHLQALEGISKATNAISYAVEGAGLLVGLVRGIVRDLIAQFIATLAARLPQWLAEEGLTLGLGTPVVIGQVTALVAKWVNKIKGFIEALLRSLKRLRPLVGKLGDILTELRALLKKLGRADPLHGDPHAPHGRGMAEDFDPATWEPTVTHEPGATAIGNDPNTADALAFAPREDGVHNVVIHGNQHGFAMGTTPEEVAAAVRANPSYVPGQPIRLITCWGGNMTTPMARELKTTVHGYNTKLYVNPDGSFAGGGQWQNFDWENDGWMLE